MTTAGHTTVAVHVADTSTDVVVMARAGEKTRAAEHVYGRSEVIRKPADDQSYIPLAECKHRGLLSGRKFGKIGRFWE